MFAVQRLNITITKFRKRTNTDENNFLFIPLMNWRVYVHAINSLNSYFLIPVTCKIRMQKCIGQLLL